MFIRMTIMQLRTESIDAAVGIFKDSVLPAARAQEGFRKEHLLIDRQTGKFVCVTFWKTREDAAASEENRFYQEQLIKFMGFFAAPPIKEDYELIVADENP